MWYPGGYVRIRDLNRKIFTSILKFSPSWLWASGQAVNCKNPLFPHVYRGHSSSEITGPYLVHYLIWRTLLQHWSSRFYPLLRPPSLSSQAWGLGWSILLVRVFSTEGIFIYLRSSPLTTHTLPRYPCAVFLSAPHVREWFFCFLTKRIFGTKAYCHVLCAHTCYNC